MEQYLRIFVSHQQDDWVLWLPLAEFAANNETSDSTHFCPFFAVTATDPRMTFDEEIPGPRDSREIDADLVQDMLQQVHENLRTEMQRSQSIMEEGAKRKRIPAPNMQVGTKVWLDARHIRTTRPSQQLDWK
jgi:hypothetical protein